MNRRFAKNSSDDIFSGRRRERTAETKISISKKLPKDFFGPPKNQTTLKRSGDSLPSLLKASRK